MSAHALDYIKRQITEYLRQNPQDANELLASVALGMTQYKQRVQEGRKGQMQNCVGMLYSLIKKKAFSKMELACVLPSLFITFPKAKITGHSGTDVEILQKYLDGVKSYYGAYSDDFYKYRDWIRDCHGAEMAEWFDMLIANAIENGMFPNIFNTVGVTINEEV
jgi:hypothetical protein